MRRPNRPGTDAWEGGLLAILLVALNSWLRCRLSVAQSVVQALCWSHGRRKLFELVDIAEGARRKSKGATDAVICRFRADGAPRTDLMTAAIPI